MEYFYVKAAALQKYLYGCKEGAVRQRGGGCVREKRKKKVFHSNALNTLTMLERLAWLIPVYFLVKDVITGWDAYKVVLEDDPTFEVIVALILLTIFLLVAKSGFWFVLVRVALHCAKKQIMKNSTFITAADFDYYRDKLTGISPGEISLLVDLKIEPQKDVAACILKYESMRLLREENGRYDLITDDLTDSRLRPSDRFLIQSLCGGTYDAGAARKWQEFAQDEAIASGYLTRKGANTEKKKKPCVGCLVPILLFMGLAILMYRMMPDMDAYSAFLDSMPPDISFKEQVQVIRDHPEYYGILIQTVVFFFLLLLLLGTPFFAIAAGIAGKSSTARFKRTELGNEMAEYVYGMKNFIHDFSNLSEADKGQVVLWDDYLIYAVVLEENQQIVDEIMQRRRRR